MYDIIFISYNEPNADENFKNLRDRFPFAKRVHGVKGIHQAHIQAAKQSFTKMFWVVDGDAVIQPEFDFSYKVTQWDLDVVHVWRSINPVNDLKYGYGGVKLLPKNLTINMDLSKPDMTTSISTKFKAMPEVSNITAFNTDEFTTWRSAFRECTKLASKVIDGQISEESQQRLDVWCTQSTDKNALKGALAGRKYGQENAGNIPALSKINDFTWLQDQWSLER
jgi:hypothetical protein